MAGYELSHADLESHLSDQLGSLQRAAHAFDEGYRAEAKRMATILRVLLHTRRYPSLLKQLGRDQIDFVDSANPPVEGNLLTTHGLIGLSFHDGRVFYTAKLDVEGLYPKLPFELWWAATAFVDKMGRVLTRSDVVLTAADQDGGAHVDKVLRDDYAGLSRENSLNWVTENEAGEEIPIANPELAAIRQIAHEVLKTLVSGYVRTREQALAARRQPEISGGKLRFYPSGAYFMQNAGAPTVAGASYIAEIAVDSITTGAVMMIVGGAAGDRVTSAGVHQMLVTAAAEQELGVFGDHTDAVIDRVSVKPVG